MRLRNQWTPFLCLTIVFSWVAVGWSLSAPPSSSTIQSPRVLADYAIHWEDLLLKEYQENVMDLKERRKMWSLRRLEENGLAVLDATAEPDSEILGEKIVRVHKPGNHRFRDLFSRGDVLVMTPDNNDRKRKVDLLPRECIVVDVGKDWMTVGVGSSWPQGLWETRKHPGLFQIRLDRAAAQAPLRAQRIALERLRKGEAGAAASLLAELFQNSTQAKSLARRIPTRFGPDCDMQHLTKYALEQALKRTEFSPNQSQKDAVSWAIQRTIGLVRGPPGTGKTRAAALIVSAALHMKMENQTNPRVLAVTHSNGAADVLLEALLQMGVPAIRHGRPASIAPNIQHRTVVAMAEKVPEIVELRRLAGDASVEKQVRSSAIFDLKQRTKDVQEMITRSAPVVVTSCVAAQQLFTEHTGRKGSLFEMVVLDEAAQTTEPALLCALAAAKAEQVILLGDTRQLPPTVTSKSKELRETLGISPMARLEQCGVDEFTLSEQYRMPPFLLEHPSRYFYKGLVRCAASAMAKADSPSPQGFPWPNQQPLAFLQVGNRDAEVNHNFGGRSNPREAQMVVDIVSRLIRFGDVQESKIAVISPYAKQVQLIRSELLLSSRKMLRSDNIRVGTVDSFQGQETDIVIFSAVRSNEMNELGFLRDSRRLCVALTRARRGLILVGDKNSLQSCHHWTALLDSCHQRNCILTEADWMRSISEEYVDEGDEGVPTSNSTPSQEDILAELLDTSDEFYGLF